MTTYSRQNNLIKKYQDPGSPITLDGEKSIQDYFNMLKPTTNVALDQAEDLVQLFYKHDVEPRAARERSLIEKGLYYSPRYDESIPITEDEMDLSTGGYYDSVDKSIHLSSDYPESFDKNLAHEMTHANQYKHIMLPLNIKNRLKDAAWAFPKWIHSGFKYADGFQITPSERKLLNRAYQTNEDLIHPDSKDIAEKHASNREIRFQIWKNLYQELGRIPSIDEVDEYIRKLEKTDFLKDYRVNGYTRDYYQHSDYSPEDQKNALIHVAQNNSSNPDQQSFYAKQGGSLNYLDYIPKYQSAWGVLKTLPRRIAQKATYYYNKLTGSHKGELSDIKELNGEGTDVVNLDKDVIRVTPDTEQRGTLFNEFVEESNNRTIRTAKEYKDLPDDYLISDGQFPKSNINLYAGIEDGHFKIDSLQNFNDTTTIIPVRNIKSGTSPISSFYITKNKGPEISEEEFEAAKKFNEKHKIPGHLNAYDAFYNIKSKLGRTPTIEELTNLAARLQLNWRSDEYLLSDDINELLSPLSDEENELIKANGINVNQYPMVVKDKYLQVFKTKNRMPVGLRHSFWYVPDDVPTSEDKLASDSIAYSLADPRHASKYVQNRRLAQQIADNYELMHKYYQWNNENLDEDLESGNLKVITSEGDVIPVGKYNASILDKKAVLGNPNGGLFIADFKNLSQGQLDTIVNPYLQKNPSWLFMPDMGAYSLYGLKGGIDPKLKEYTESVLGSDLSENPTYADYWNQFSEKESKAPYNPNVHYLVGVKKQGGTINYLNY